MYQFINYLFIYLLILTYLLFHLTVIIATPVWTSGEPWLELRRFSLTSLRTFGMGKKSLEPRINLEARYLCEELERSRGSPQYIQLTLNKATANVISQLVYGRRYDYHDEEYDRLIAATFAALTTVSTADPAVIFPFLMKTPLYKKLQQNRMILKNFTMSQLYSHQNTFQKENIRDITDAFLADNISEVYNIEEFCRIVMDYFAAGTETTSTFLSWTILYLAIHPNVQKKVRTEKFRT